MIGRRRKIHLRGLRQRPHSHPVVAVLAKQALGRVEQPLGRDRRLMLLAR